jgi:5-methylcytosine-specific restriction protein A
MPNRPLRKCTTPGCPTQTSAGRCLICRRLKRRLTRTRKRAVDDYGPRWTAVRLDYLIRHPRCTLCPRLSMIPDHYPESRRTLVARGVLDPDQDQYLRALCKPCHDRQTAIHQPGGWARERGS